MNNTQLRIFRLVFFGVIAAPPLGLVYFGIKLLIMDSRTVIPVLGFFLIVLGIILTYKVYHFWFNPKPTNSDYDEKYDSLIKPNFSGQNFNNFEFQNDFLTYNEHSFNDSSNLDILENVDNESQVISDEHFDLIDEGLLICLEKVKGGNRFNPFLLLDNNGDKKVIYFAFYPDIDVLFRDAEDEINKSHPDLAVLFLGGEVENKDSFIFKAYNRSNCYVYKFYVNFWELNGEVKCDKKISLMDFSEPNLLFDGSTLINQGYCSQITALNENNEEVSSIFIGYPNLKRTLNRLEFVILSLLENLEDKVTHSGLVTIFFVPNENIPFDEEFKTQIDQFQDRLEKGVRFIAQMNFFKSLEKTLVIGYKHSESLNNKAE